MDHYIFDGGGGGWGVGQLPKKKKRIPAQDKATEKNRASEPPKTHMEPIEEKPDPEKILT